MARRTRTIQFGTSNTIEPPATELLGDGRPLATVGVNPLLVLGPVFVIVSIAALVFSFGSVPLSPRAMRRAIKRDGYGDHANDWITWIVLWAALLSTVAGMVWLILEVWSEAESRVPLAFGLLLTVWGWVQLRLKGNSNPFRYPTKEKNPHIARELRVDVILPWVMLWSGAAILVITVAVVAVRMST